jgi:hypothetical protein
MRFNENYWSLQIVKEMVVEAGFIVMYGGLLGS